MSTDPVVKIESFRVMWKDLSYTAKSFRGNTKTILKEVNGYFESGQITAIMGPSGCGKSTLLGCISGIKRKGVTGSITISNKINVKFALIDQDNYILNRLTVWESLIFASKLRNGSSDDHNKIVTDVINKLAIKHCANLKPHECSGGQLKRVLVAIEMVTRPNILILDEPTSGLDAFTAKQLILTLSELTQLSDPVAVVVTIHQPSAKLFNLFNNIYLLSYRGECIYFGGPQNINDYFKHFQFFCPQFTNPADYALEVASGEHESTKLTLLAHLRRNEAIALQNYSFHIKPERDTRTLNQTFQLTIRSLTTNARDPFMLPLRFFLYIICGILISLQYRYDSGIYSGCAEDFALKSGDDLLKKYELVGADLAENYAGICIICLLGWFGGIFPVLLQFNTEMFNFVKEYRNGYYSCFSFLISKVLSDIPFSLLLPNLASIPTYYLTGQYSYPIWRVYHFSFIYILVVFNSSALGFLIGVSMAKHPTAIAFIGTLSLTPLILLSGAMVRLTAIPKLFQWMSYLNYFRFGVSAAVLDIYGFGRCDNQILNQTHWTDSITAEQMLQVYSSDKINAESLLSTVESVLGVFNNDDSRSIILKFSHLYDTDYYFSIFMLLSHLFILRTITYFLIILKIDSLI